MTPDAVPSRPIRTWLHAWMAATGDPVEVVAAGFAIDRDVVLDLLSSEPPRMIAVAVARELCVGLRAHPAELWRAHVAAAVGTCEWPVEPLWADVLQRGPGL